jgi:hypothetical protein
MLRKATFYTPNFLPNFESVAVNPEGFIAREIPTYDYAYRFYKKGGKIKKYQDPADVMVDPNENIPDWQKFYNMMPKLFNEDGSIVKTTPETPMFYDDEPMYKTSTTGIVSSYLNPYKPYNANQKLIDAEKAISTNNTSILETPVVERNKITGPVTTTVKKQNSTESMGSSKSDLKQRSGIAGELAMGIGSAATKLGIGLAQSNRQKALARKNAEIAKSSLETNVPEFYGTFDDGGIKQVYENAAIDAESAANNPVTSDAIRNRQFRRQAGAEARRLRLEGGFKQSQAYSN